MERLTAFLELVRDRGLVAGHFRGLCHVAVGRKVTDPAGLLVSGGVTWRELSVLLRDLRFDKALVGEVGADPDELAPRDRQRFWYSAIALARPDSPEARAEADRLAKAVAALGYTVGPPPPVSAKSLTTPPPPPPPDDEPDPPKRGKPRKK